MKELDKVNKRTNKVSIVLMIAIAFLIFGVVLKMFGISLIGDILIAVFISIAIGCMFYHIITINEFVNILNNIQLNKQEVKK